MTKRRTNSSRKEECIANQRNPPRVDQVPIVCLQNVNETVPPPEPQGPQGHQMPPMPQAFLI